jgi:hypothetical protein
LEESHACVSIPTDLETRFSSRRFDVGRLPPREKAALPATPASEPAEATDGFTDGLVHKWTALGFKVPA